MLEPGLNIKKLRLVVFQSNGIVVVVNATTIDLEQSLFSNIELVMEIGDAAECVARLLGALLEGSLVAVNEITAHGEVHPVAGSFIRILGHGGLSGGYAQ